MHWFQSVDCTDNDDPRWAGQDPEAAANKQTIGQSIPSVQPLPDAVIHRLEIAENPMFTLVY